MKSYYVYILLCADKTYYTGVTNDIERRFNEHCDGRNVTSYTFSRRPVEIVFCETFYDIEKAIAYEKRLKKWSQKKKEALIQEKFELLPTLAKKKFKK